MSEVRLVCDSTADLDPEFAQAHEITVVPLRVIFGEEELKDFVDIQPTEFYRRMRSGGVHPRTSQPTPAEFEEVFRRLAADGSTIVCTTISADMSGTWSSAHQARQALPDLDIRVHDTRSVAVGHQLAMRAAVAARDAGGDASAVIAALETVRERMELVFTVESLDALRRGGRIGGARALLGTMLNIKPVLQVKDGQVDALDRVRTYQRAIDRLLTELKAAHDRWGGAVAGVAHADCRDRAEAFAARVREITGTDPIIEFVGPVIGCHGGPGALGLAFHPPIEGSAA